MADVYQMVTDRILAALDLGEIPWHRPWCSVGGGAYNRITEKPYSLLNQMLLSHTGEYASLQQWNKLGGRIRKGERSEFVVFWKWCEPKKEETQETEDKEEDQESGRILDRPILRYYRVFHISQVEGVAPLPQRIRLYNHDPIEEAERLINSYLHREGIVLEEELSDTAYYSPARDLIHIPSIKQYEELSEYYSTLLHEAVHSTGHSTRLNRAGLQNVSFGSAVYSKEELIAEIGSACLLSDLGIETDRSMTNSAAYIQGWLHALKNDRKLVVMAAAQAQKAAEYICGRYTRDMIPN